MVPATSSGSNLQPATTSYMACERFSISRNPIIRSKLAVLSLKADIQRVVLSSVFSLRGEERLKRESTIPSAKERRENSTEYLQRFPPLAVFLDRLLTAMSERRLTFSWRSLISHYSTVSCVLQFTDVAQVADAARNWKSFVTGYESNISLGNSEFCVLDTTKGNRGWSSSRDLSERYMGASSSGHADKKPDASGRIFALTQDQAACWDL
ncbi:hypothetical protein Tco_1311394 [Tanacetum coccineum]